MTFADKKKSFVLYNNYSAFFERLNDEQAGRLIKALFEFNDDGIVADLDDDLTVSMLFDYITRQMSIDRQKYEEKCERNRQIALEREKKKREQSSTDAHERERSNTKSTDNDIEIERGIDMGIDMGIDRGIDRGIDTDMENHTGSEDDGGLGEEEEKPKKSKTEQLKEMMKSNDDSSEEPFDYLGHIFGNKGNKSFKNQRLTDDLQHIAEWGRSG